MSIQEQQELKGKHYNEAMRYMENAKECLKKAKKAGKYYDDQKYVRMACGTAYSGVLVALDCFFSLKGINHTAGDDRKSIKYYQQNLSNTDNKMLKSLRGVYKILHLSGYYDGIENVNVIKEGFDEAYDIIEKIKPDLKINK